MKISAKFLKPFIAVFTIAVFFSFQFAFFNPGSASAADEIKKAADGMKETASAAFGTAPEPFNIYQKIGSYVGIALTFLGIIFLGLALYGGFTWMVARGNPEDAKKAMQVLMDALIGLVIILSAYAITVFIGNFLAQK